MIGAIVDGKYEVQRLLGKGGMGAVYEVLHTGTNRRLALKVIDSGEAAKHKGLVVRLQREARAAGSIDSPHIGQVIDAGTDPATDAPYLVMELLEGEDLQEALNRVGMLPPDVVLRIVGQACLGLAKAHEARVIHRDVKPANIYLARQRDGEILVKVLDFGIAKLKQDELSQLEGSLTRTGSVLGSPLYMSPEQARGAKTIDHRADLWSLGVVAYQLLTGRTPYQEIDALGELILAICSELPPCVQDFAPWVDRDVAATVHKALSLDAIERFQTAGEMFDEIGRHLTTDPNTGKPDLRLDASMIVGVEAGARSIARPRLIAVTGRRPAHTRPTSQSIVTPPPSDHDLDRPVSAAEIEGGATLLLTPGGSGSGLSGSGAGRSGAGLSGSGSGGSSSGERPGATTAISQQIESRSALAALAAPPVTQGTAPGLSRSSPAAPPERRVGAFFAGATLAAVLAGTAVAVLMSGVLKPGPAAGASAQPAEKQAESAVAKLDPPPALTTPAVASSAAGSEPRALPSASAAVPSAYEPAATPRSAPPRSPSGPRTPPGPPSATPAPSSVPKPPNSGTNGFGDRK